MRDLNICNRWKFPEATQSFKGNESKLPKISIVTPCYNSVDYIERTIRSVLLQGYINLEYIVLDGGSKDGSVEIIRYYDQYIDYWISKPDKGQSDCLNRGLDMATGDILGWLNSDDLFLPDALNAIAKSYLEDPNRNVFLALASIVDKQLNPVHQQKYENIGPKAFLDYRKNYVIQPGCLFSKKAWETCRPIREDLEYSMDFDLFYRMSEHFEFHRINQEIAYSVFHEEAKTVRDRAASIAETALVQAQFGGFEIARRELTQVAKEHKYLERITQKNNHSKKDKLNVLFVITHLNCGGGQTFLVRLINALANKVNPYLMIFWVEEKDDSLLAQLSKSCVDISSYDLCNPDNFRQKVADLKIDIIHSHLFHADQFVTSALQDINIPIIITDHGDYKYVEELELANFEETRNILLRANTIIAISNNNSDILKEKYGEDLNIKSIYLGVEPWIPTKNRHILRKALGIPDNEVVFICAARGNKDKGWAELLTSFMILSRQTDKNAHLLCLGDGEYLKQLQILACSSELKNVHFLGFQANPRNWMEVADVSMLLSYFPGESTPCGLIESLSLGKPVIATDVGGISEIVGAKEEDKAGILIPIDERGKADINFAIKAMEIYINKLDNYRYDSWNAKNSFDKKFSIKLISQLYLKEYNIKN